MIQAEALKVATDALEACMDFVPSPEDCRSVKNPKKDDKNGGFNP